MAFNPIFFGQVYFGITYKPFGNHTNNIEEADQLRNGALILASKRHKHYDENYPSHVVLCMWRKREYITWLVDPFGHAHLGHYFNHIQAATDDFINR